ncbi:SNF2 domain-containing protein CLASSY [Trifolium repens]|nr:SNF2 domain-containing protein CLASSY [Trifolium repens]
MYKIFSSSVHFRTNFNWSMIKDKGRMNWLNTRTFSLEATQRLRNSPKNFVLTPTLLFNLCFSSRSLSTADSSCSISVSSRKRDRWMNAII